MLVLSPNSSSTSVSHLPVTHTKVTKLLHTFIDSVKQYVSFEATGESVLSSIDNLVMRHDLLEQCSAIPEQQQQQPSSSTSSSSSTSRRLLGPLMFFGGGVVPSLMQKHAEELTKQQRNTQTIIDALQETQTTLCQVTAEMIEVMEKGGCFSSSSPPPPPHHHQVSLSSSSPPIVATPAIISPLHHKSPERPMSLADMLQVATQIKRIIAMDMSNKLDIFIATSAFLRTTLTHESSPEEEDEVDDDDDEGKQRQMNLQHWQRTAQGWSGVKNMLLFHDKETSAELHHLVWKCTGKTMQHLWFHQQEGEEEEEEEGTRNLRRIG